MAADHQSDADGTNAVERWQVLIKLKSRIHGGLLVLRAKEIFARNTFVTNENVARDTNLPYEVNPFEIDWNGRVTPVVGHEAISTERKTTEH